MSHLYIQNRQGIAVHILLDTYLTDAICQTAWQNDLALA